MVKLLFSVFLFVIVRAVEYSKAGEGYPVGFISDCPGSWKPASIKPKSLEKLYLSVLAPGNVLRAKWTPYNYYQMQQLAKHPEIDFGKKTFLYVGGYLDGTGLPVGRTLGQVYNELGYNVLLLDYLEFTARDFPVAVRLTRPVGKHVAEMLANLTTLGMDPKNLELVGLSLGGQTMSFIAKNYRLITGKNISSLTGLDPTGPCYRHLGPDQRLDPSDADFVRVVATNIDGYGIATPVGHVMFYVNGGEYQPGDIWWLPCDVTCSHVRSYFLWLSALLNPGIFIGMQCDSIQKAREGNCYDRKPMVTNTMDLFTDRSKPGIYYVTTFNRYPYGLGKSGLKRSGETILRHLASLNTAETLWVK
ncbi:pancreatic lipase-related protein 2-like [Cydia pomonella]|uniref:pancreatic lipase-related protein 2-like n=1 Tax=Cydia pomonella TaxID=82600 RepID=UPI002ADE90F1|nr:pancreatic lipase-related protein 2-like [Cydia pomonella]